VELFDFFAEICFECGYVVRIDNYLETLVEIYSCCFKYYL